MRISAAKKLSRKIQHGFTTSLCHGKIQQNPYHGVNR